MAITGLTTTSDNGVERVTSLQTTGDVTIDRECVVWDNSTSVVTPTASGGATYTITNSQLKFDSDINTGSSITDSVLNRREVSTVEIYDSLLLFATTTGRVNISVSDLQRSTIIGEIINPSEGLNLYVLDGGILSDAVIDNIVGIEFVGSVSIFSNVSINSATYGYQNWFSGRLDFFGLALNNIPITSIHGFGNSGNNQTYLWNPATVIDLTICALFSTNNRIYEGITLGWEFADKLTSTPVDDLLLIFRDNLNVTGAAVGGRGRYTTVNGVLNGTYNSQDDTTTAAQDYPTLFIIYNKIDDIGANGSRTYPNPAIDLGGGLIADRNYNLDVVDIGLEIRSYLYEQPTGFNRNDIYTGRTQIGTLNPDGTTNELSPFYLTLDAGITQNTKAAVEAYTSLVNLDELYDYAKSYWYDTDDVILITYSSGNVIIPTGNTIVFTNTGAAYAYATNVITVNSNTSIASTASKSTLQSDTVTFNNGTYPYNIIINGDVYLNSAQDLSGVTINGDLYINTNLDSTLTFTDTVVSGNVFNDANSNTLTINASGATSITTTEAGTADGQVNIVSGQVTYTFNLSPAVTGYEYAIYEVTAEGSLQGSNEVKAVETEASSSFSYTFIYAPSTIIAVQVLPKGALDVKESVTYYALTNTDQTFTLNLIEDTNN